jgi:hypothetical protein
VETAALIFTIPGFKEALTAAGLVLVAIIHITSVVDKGFEGF